ncbi:hypothetical protein WKY82_07810 [Gordonia malaquae]|jgi:hypothetical protein|uniref:hypothetical protein n=1 Tax=Gordonia malaquae TaxID=410332 RepID=UPI0030C78CBC
MTPFTRTRKVLAGVLVAAAVTATAVPTADAAPAAPPLTFQIPAIGGLEIGPGGVPGGSFQPTTVVARPAVRTMIFPPPPAGVQFSVSHLAPYHYQYSYRYLRVQWHNLRTGTRGHVDLRHWKTIAGSTGYPSTLPTTAVATTGSGPVVATVSVLREQYQAPPTVISVIPGVSAIDVPR